MYSHSRVPLPLTLVLVNVYGTEHTNILFKILDNLCHAKLKIAETTQAKYINYDYYVQSMSYFLNESCIVCIVHKHQLCSRL